MDEGYNKAVAEASAEILRKNAYAKEVMQRIDALSDTDTDKLLRDLEPK